MTLCLRPRPEARDRHRRPARDFYSPTPTTPRSARGWGQWIAAGCEVPTFCAPTSTRGRPTFVHSGAARASVRRATAPPKPWASALRDVGYPRRVEDTRQFGVLVRALPITDPIRLRPRPLPDERSITATTVLPDRDTAAVPPTPATTCTSRARHPLCLSRTGFAISGTGDGSPPCLDVTESIDKQIAALISTRASALLQNGRRT